jgi:hypothetical protein
MIGCRCTEPKCATDGTGCPPAGCARFVEMPSGFPRIAWRPCSRPCAGISPAQRRNAPEPRLLPPRRAPAGRRRSSLLVSSAARAVGSSSRASAFPPVGAGAVRTIHARSDGGSMAGATSIPCEMPRGRSRRPRTSRNAITNETRRARRGSLGTRSVAVGVTAATAGALVLGRGRLARAALQRALAAVSAAVRRIRLARFATAFVVQTLRHGGSSSELRAASDVPLSPFRRILPLLSGTRLAR